MSKRQQQQVEKRSADFMGEFKKLLYRHQAWEVWRDFCTLAACSIANAVDKRHFETREKLYLDTIKRYNKTEQQEETSYLWLYIVIGAVVVLAGAGTAVYFLVIKKKHV